MPWPMIYKIAIYASVRCASLTSDVSKQISADFRAPTLHMLNDIVSMSEHLIVS